MALIKCPRCGQTVLSVASTCPKCSYLFLEAPKEESAAGALVGCRRCSRPIPPESASCPYCAYPIRRMQILARVGIGVGVAAVALVALLIALGRRAGPAPAVASPAGTTSASLAAQPADPAGTERVQQPAAPVGGDTGLRRSPAATVPPPVAPERSPAPQPRTTSPPATTPPQRTPPARPAAPGARDTRWALDWVNVREGRGVANAVVAVLRPGVQVQVADQRGGWWAIYLNGSFVGYASGSLFSPEPPSDTTL